MGKKKLENKSNSDEEEDSILEEEDPEMLLEKEREEDYLFNGEDDEKFNLNKIQNPPSNTGKILLRAAKKIITSDLDPNYNIDENYFYQELTENEWEEIKSYILSKEELNEKDIENFFHHIQNY